jgi:hypothetical protein
VLDKEEKETFSKNKTEVSAIEITKSSLLPSVQKALLQFFPSCFPVYSRWRLLTELGLK